MEGSESMVWTVESEAFWREEVHAAGVQKKSCKGQGHGAERLPGVPVVSVAKGPLGRRQEMAKANRHRKTYGFI